MCRLVVFFVPKNVVVLSRFFVLRDLWCTCRRLIIKKSSECSSVKCRKVSRSVEKKKQFILCNHSFHTNSFAALNKKKKKKKKKKKAREKRRIKNIWHAHSVVN